jgi:hypothetical protein
MHNRTFYAIGTRHEILILGVGIIVAVLIYCIFPITYFPDSDQYYNFGKAILGQVAGNTSNFRGLGIPLLLIVSGVFQLETFKLFVLLQLLMGIAMPLVLYQLLSQWSKRYALYISIIVTLSLIPYGYSKAILSEQAYMFILLLLVNNSVKLQQTLEPKYLYFQSMYIFLLVIIKPIAGLIFIIFIAYNIYIFKKRLLQVMLSSILLFTLVIISNQYSENLFKHAPEHQKRQHMAGSILFYNLYLSSNIEARTCDLNSINSLKKLLTEINKYYLKHPEEYRATLDTYRDNPEAFKLLFKPYINNPVALSQAIIDKPTKYYYSFIYYDGNRVAGNARADRMMLDAAIEMISAFPSLASGYLLRNLYAFAAGRNISYSYYVAREKRITEYFPPSLEPLTWDIVASPESDLPLSMQKELDTGKVNHVKKFSKIRDFVLVEVWGRLFLIFRPVVFLCTLLSVLLLYKDPRYLQLLLCMSLIIYHMLITCIFNIPLNRYLIPTMIPEIFCAAAFAYSLRKRFSKGRTLAQKVSG